MLHRYQEYELSDASDRIDLEAVCSFLSRSYWAARRSRETIARTIANSICFGAYHQGEQVAFARVVTDGAVIYWLGDVWVREDHRGRGLGKELVRVVTEDPRLHGLVGILSTQDAHGLYEKLGFKREPLRFMYRFPVTSAAQPSHAAVADHAPAQD